MTLKFSVHNSIPSMAHGYVFRVQFAPGFLDAEKADFKYENPFGSCSFNRENVGCLLYREKDSDAVQLEV